MVGVNSISSAYLHVRPMGRTCRWVDEITKNSPPRIFYRPLFASRYRSGTCAGTSDGYKCSAQPTCAAGKYLDGAAEDKRGDCKDQPTCAAGEQLVGGTSTQRGSCSKCADNQYNPGTGCTQCPVKSCEGGEFLQGQCAGSADARKCQTCSNAECGEGEYRSGTCAGTTDGYECTAQPTCPGGKRLTGATTTQKGTCKQWVGVCEHGQLLLPASQRNKDGHCGACNAGYYTEDGKCLSYTAGECLTDYTSSTFTEAQIDVLEAAHDAGGGGELVPQEQRTGPNQCAKCTPQFKLVNQKCQPACMPGSYLRGSCQQYGGTCQHGTLAPQAARSMENECGSCEAGYALGTQRACVTADNLCTVMMQDNKDSDAAAECKEAGLTPSNALSFSFSYLNMASSSLCTAFSN